MSFWNEVVQPALNGVFADVLGILPNVLGAALILLIGWIVAKAASKIVEKLLKRVSFNKIAGRAGVEGFLKNAGITQQPAQMIGRLVYWMLLLIFFLSAAEAMNLTALALTLQRVVAFIPNLIAVVFILVFGAMLARFVGRLVQGTAAEAGIDFAQPLGKLVNFIIILAIFVIAVAQLEIHSAVLDIFFATMLGAFGLAVAVTLGIGTRGISENIISGVYARKSFAPGQILEIGDVQGEIISIGTINTVVNGGEDRIVLPNSYLVEKVSTLKKPGTGD